MTKRKNTEMQLKQSTQVPNIVFDKYLPNLTGSELKILLIIIRQTYGWIDKRTGKRKSRDRISHSQFITKTALSKGVVSKAIKSLIAKRIIQVTDYRGHPLSNAKDRKGKFVMYYSFQPVRKVIQPCADFVPGPMRKVVYNKTNYTKLKKTKRGEVRSVRELLKKYPPYSPK
jgi:phage replication O-like protein O